MLRHAGRDPEDDSAEGGAADREAARDRLLDGLNDAQREAVTTSARPLAILAGAGSGKTRVLTHRIARRALDEEIDPARVLAVTFTRKAAAELRERLGRLGLSSPVNAGTFHAIAYAQLRQRWAERGITPPELLDRKVGFVARLLGGRSSTAPLDAVAEIEWAKARMIPASGYPGEAAKAGRRSPIPPDDLAALYARYEEEKLRRRLVDFDDLLRLATRDLVRDPEYAAARRWRYRHLFVDEFQDVNPLQFELLQSWLGDSPDAADLCVVGDPNQAIYSWNGADASYLERFDEWFPTAETVRLVENYRSTAQILGVANIVLASSAGPGAPSRHALQLRPNRGDGPLPTVTVYDDEIAEARAIARRVRDAHSPGRSWSDQAVLVRTNQQLVVLEEAFGKVGIPTRSRGGGRLLDQPEVKDALGALARGGGHLRERLDDLEISVTSPEGSEADAGASPSRLNDERAANVAELVRLGREYLDLDPEGSAGAFRAWLISTLRADDGAGARDAVDLATFHAAKGLEWSIVHLAGLEEGLVPIHHAQNAESQAEERRLLYVALTRAERQLHCSRAERRAFGSRSVQRRPSPYLETIELALELLSEGNGPIDIAAAVASERAKLRESDGEPPRRRRRRTTTNDEVDLDTDGRRLLDQLKAWRLGQSRANDVPAFVIFNDATLTEVARRRPRTRAELMSVPGIGAVKAERFGPAVLEIVGGDD